MIKYEVWALGYDKDNCCTDIEEFLGEFETKEAAVAHAKKFKDISYIYEQDILNDYLQPGDYCEIRVESIETSDSNELYCENLDTVYVQLCLMPNEVR